jgi:hypothetical protein
MSKIKELFRDLPLLESNYCCDAKYNEEKK